MMTLSGLKEIGKSTHNSTRNSQRKVTINDRIYFLVTFSFWSQYALLIKGTEQEIIILLSQEVKKKVILANLIQTWGFINTVFKIVIIITIITRL